MDPVAQSATPSSPPPPPNGQAPGEFSFAEIVAEARAKVASGELRDPPSVAADLAQHGGMNAQPPPEAKPPAPPPAEDPARLIEENAAKRLAREREELSAREKAWEERQAQATQREQEYQSRLAQAERQAAELAAWKANMIALAKADPVAFQKEHLQFSDDDVLHASHLGWTRVEGEAAPKEVRERYVNAQLEQKIAAMDLRMRQQEIQLREYQIMNGIHQAAAPLLPGHQHVAAMASSDPDRFSAEMYRSANELAAQHKRAPTANEVLKQTEDRLARERAYWLKIGPPPATPASPTTQPQQPSANPVPAAPTQGLSPAAPHRAPAPDLPQDDRAAFRQAFAEAQAKFGSGSG